MVTNTTIHLTEFPAFAAKFNKLIPLAPDHGAEAKVKHDDYIRMISLFREPIELLRSGILADGSLFTDPAQDEVLKAKFSPLPLKDFTYNLAMFLRKNFEAMILKPVISKIPQEERRLATNLQSGLSNMIEMFFGFTNIIPVIYQQQTGHVIDSQNFEKILSRTKEHIKEYTKLHFNIFFKHIRNIIRGYEDQVPASLFPDIDFKANLFEIAKVGSTEDLTLVPKVDTLETALKARLKAEPPLPSPALTCPAAKGVEDSLVDVTFDFMMGFCKKFFFPIWDKINGLGIGLTRMPSREKVMSILATAAKQSGGCPFHTAKPA